MDRSAASRHDGAEPTSWADGRDLHRSVMTMAPRTTEPKVEHHDLHISDKWEQNT